MESILFQGVDLSWLKGVEFRPEILMRGGKDQANWEHRKRLVHMFREFERLCNETQAISEMEI